MKCENLKKIGVKIAIVRLDVGPQSRLPEVCVGAIEHLFQSYYPTRFAGNAKLNRGIHNMCETMLKTTSKVTTI